MAGCWQSTTTDAFCSPAPTRDLNDGKVARLASITLTSASAFTKLNVLVLSSVTFELGIAAVICLIDPFTKAALTDTCTKRGSPVFRAKPFKATAREVNLFNIIIKDGHMQTR